ncbi:MAG: hypothetical protein QM228_01130 [Atribacterota bacterium]|nr:hypothetical protein [Atribacterota bacterium]
MKYNVEDGYARFLLDLNCKIWVNPFLKEFVKREGEETYIFPVKTKEKFKSELDFLCFYYADYFKGLDCGDNQKLKDAFIGIGCESILKENIK